MQAVRERLYWRPLRESGDLSSNRNLLTEMMMKEIFVATPDDYPIYNYKVTATILKYFYSYIPSS